MGKGVVPLEVLIDLRCASNYFDRLVPQTDAILHYDKFNRLRLRNNATAATRSSTDSEDEVHNHLHSQNVSTMTSRTSNYSKLFYHRIL